MIKATMSNGRIELRGSYTSELEGFYRSLPTCRWDKRRLCWSCAATPAAAARIVESGVQADDDVRGIADGFASRSSAAALFRESEGPQPGIRKTELWRHQLRAYHFAAQLESTMLSCAMGCVDCETEFLSPDGWKRIDQWDRELVAQYHPDTGAAEFVNPTTYIKLPCEDMYHFRHGRGLDQMLSDEHRVLWFDSRKRPRVNSANEIANGVGGQHVKFQSAFTLEHGNGIPLSENELRLQIAIIADGHFPNKTSRCVVRLKKQRKIARLKDLLGDTPYKIRIETDGFHCFSFLAPRREKSFGRDWWEATSQQRTIICDEVYRWDGSERKSGAVAFFSSVPESADFIQYCFSSTGRRASISKVQRDGRTECTVHAVGNGRSSNFVHLARQNGNIERVHSPDGFKYCFEVPTRFLVLRRNGCVFTTGNTGKSLVAITLICNRGDKLVLIVCPTTVMSVWRREFSKHAPFPWDILVLDGTQTVKRKAEIARRIAEQGGHRAIVVNYEAIWRPEFKAFASSISWDCVIADESHRAKGNGSKTSKALADIGKAAKHRLALTGTPMPHSPMDIFGQFRFLDPGIFGTSYHYFRTRFAISGHFGADHIVGFQNQDELAARMRLVTFEVTSDVLDLPAAQHHQRTFDLSKKTRAVYDSLEQEMIALVESGTITAANALVKLLRLQQITSGFVTNDDGDEIEIGTEKVAMLADLLEDIADPVVVFCNFRRDLRLIEGVTEKLGRSYGEISGKRKDLTEHAQMPEGIDVMGVQIRSGGVGIDLTRAAYSVHWNLPWSRGDFDQSLARINRPGQTRPVNHYYLIANGTIDEKVFSALEKKRDVVEEVMAHLRHGETQT